MSSKMGKFLQILRILKHYLVHRQFRLKVFIILTVIHFYTTVKSGYWNKGM